MGRTRNTLGCLMAAVLLARIAVPAEGPSQGTVEGVQAAMVQVRATGWVLRTTDPERIVRVWDLPVRFTSLTDLERVVAEGRLAKLNEAMDRPVTLDFAETPVQDVLEFLQRFTGVPFLVQANVRKAGTAITLKVRDVPLEKALAFILKFARCRSHVVDGVIVVSRDDGTPPGPAALLCDSASSKTLAKLGEALETPVTLDFADTPLQDVIAFLRDTRLSGINLLLDTRGLPPDRLSLTLRIENEPLARALSSTMTLTGTRLHLVGDVVILSLDPHRAAAAEGKRRVVLRPDAFAVAESLMDIGSPELQGALNRPVTLDFADTPVDDVVAFLRDFSRVNMVFDPTALDQPRQTVTFKCTDYPLKDALEFIFDAGALDYRARGDVVFISRGGSIRRRAYGWDIPRVVDPEVASMRWDMLTKLGRPATVDFKDTPLKDVTTFMTDFLGVSVAADPLLLEAAGGRPITMKLKEVPATQHLAMVAYMADLRPYVHNGIVYLTSDEAGELRQNRGRTREGVGVAVSPDGHVLTDLRTVEQAEAIQVRAAEGKWLPARLVRLDTDAGTALLKVDGPPLPWVRPAK